MEAAMLIKLRELYSYDANDLELNIKSTSRIVGVVAKGVYSRIPQAQSINLRGFEKIVYSVFEDFALNYNENTLTEIHRDNLKEVVRAIVYWKMYSQGGRAKRLSTNVLNKWSKDTERMLVNGFNEKDFSSFKIKGVRIPTASSIIRFIYPSEFGIIDSRVVGNYTQHQGITSLNLRDDGYILDTKANSEKYLTEYIAFLRKTASELNEKRITFRDIDEAGEEILTNFRPCDVEMALFNFDIQ